MVLPKVTIYTDGACKPNPGPGGWGAVLLFQEGGPVELSAGREQTTNNRMELQAAIEALSFLDNPHDVTIYTDSQYVKNGITRWLPRWQRRNWMTTADTPVKNKELWQRLSQTLNRHTVHWKWIKGHGDNRWNNRADELAVAARLHPQLPIDDDRAVHIFTAVSCSAKTGRGSWGVVLRYRRHVKIISGDARKTTGNRMHILSAIEGLAALKKRYPVHLYTWSGYLRDGAEKWLDRWRRKGWKTEGGEQVKHRDLWERLGRLLQKQPINWHLAPKKNPPCAMQEAKELAREKITPADTVPGESNQEDCSDRQHHQTESR